MQIFQLTDWLTSQVPVGDLRIPASGANLPRLVPVEAVTSLYDAGERRNSFDKRQHLARLARDPDRADPVTFVLAPTKPFIACEELKVRLVEKQQVDAGSPKPSEAAFQACASTRDTPIRYWSG